MSDPSSANSAASPIDGSTSRTLLHGLHANEAAAWDRLVTLYAPLVYHWCRRQGLPGSEMGDVLQDVFQAVAAHIGGFRKQLPDDTFRGWLRSITRSKVADYYRRRAGQPQAIGGTSANLQWGRLPAPSECASENELLADALAERELLHRGLNLIREEFEPRTWQAFWQTAVESRSAVEVARQLNMTSGAVRVAKCRVLRRLKEQLGDAI